MRSFIGDHEIANDTELTELAFGLGLDPGLWLGVAEETDTERAARMDAARDILADDPELAPSIAALTASVIERLAAPEFVRAVAR